MEPKFRRSGGFAVSKWERLGSVGSGECRGVESGDLGEILGKENARAALSTRNER